MEFAEQKGLVSPVFSNEKQTSFKVKLLLGCLLLAVPLAFGLGYLIGHNNDTPGGAIVIDTAEEAGAPRVIYGDLGGTVMHDCHGPWHLIPKSPHEEKIKAARERARQGTIHHNACHGAWVSQG